MEPDRVALYAKMRRRLEEAIAELWRQGRISGEMHLGIGEEGINVGALDHLGDGDAVALDHRGTAGILLRGVDMAAIVKECMGAVDGLCGGMGGHMHLYSRVSRRGTHASPSRGRFRSTLLASARPCRTWSGSPRPHER